MNTLACRHNNKRTAGVRLSIFIPKTVEIETLDGVHIGDLDKVSVYLADMRVLPETAPAVYKEFQKGNCTVSCTENPFIHQWSDMYSMYKTSSCHQFIHMDTSPSAH